jgi:hypothetical protein
LVTTTNRISRQTQHVANAQGISPEQVGLKGEAVAIATGQLQHRLNANIQQASTNGQAAHPHHGPAAIGDIHSMDVAQQMGCGFQCARYIRASRRGDLGGDGEFATG